MRSAPGVTAQACHNFSSAIRVDVRSHVADDVLDRAAELWVKARDAGQPQRDADLIIAATALIQARTLVTGNTSHFEWINGLTISDWRTA